ncbi:MAG: exodeoxyribonuclease III [Bacteroidetes bacterium]|nr:exodeoxyribonuclease III [Bacteroidota bacterium]
MKRIISYNVNGIRAALKKGLLDWIKIVDPDIICFQETKAQPGQIPLFDFEEAGYINYWFSARKKGYSGVALLTKQTPDNVLFGMDIPKYDDEGRFLRADYGDVSVVSVYFPSGSSGDVRQAFKMQWLEDFQNYIDNLKKERPNLIICGDFNICHKAIDIHDPIGNAKSTGFLPEERTWMSKFLESGFIDSFRYFNKEPNNYTWWSYRANARARNLGWRIDYCMVSLSLESKMKNALILPEAKHSDHCPIVLEIDFKGKKNRNP